MANQNSRLQLADYLLGTRNGSRNYIKNPIPYASTINTSTASGASVSRNTTSPLTSPGDFSVDFGTTVNAAVTWDMRTLDNEMKYKNCELRGSYTLTNGSGSPVVKAQILQGSAVAAEATLIASSDPQTLSLNVPCGDLGSASSMKLIMTTAGGSATTMKVSNLYYGAATNVGSVTQAQWYGAVSAAYASNCEWDMAGPNGTWTSFSADSDCNAMTPQGNASAPSTKIPAITFTSLPPGRYKFELTGASMNAYSSSGACTYRFFDGTTGFGSGMAFYGSASHINQNIEGTVEYTTAQSNLTIQVQVNSSNPSVRCGLQNSSLIYSPMTINVYRYPLESETVYRPELQNTFAAAYWAPGPTGRVASVTSAAWTTFSDPDFATRTNSGIAIDPASTSTIGLKVPYLPAGKYKLRAQGQFLASSGEACLFALYDGTTRRSQTAMPTGPMMMSSLEGVFEYSAAQSNVEFVIQAYRGGGSGSGCQVYADYGGPSLDSLTMVLEPITQNTPAPVLVGSITSNSVGAERVERVRFGGASDPSPCTGSPCTVYSKSGSWVSSVTRSGTGSYQINFNSGMFSSAPTCVASADGATYNVWAQVNTATTSSVYVYGLSSNSTTQDGNFNVICMGPR